MNKPDSGVCEEFLQNLLKINAASILIFSYQNKAYYIMLADSFGGVMSSFLNIYISVVRKYICTQVQVPVKARRG